MLKRLLLAAALVVSVLGPLAPQASSQSSDAPAVQTKDCTVYITRYGHRYHKAGCRYLRQSSFSISRSEAVARGYMPCRVCGGSACER